MFLTTMRSQNHSLALIFCSRRNLHEPMRRPWVVRVGRVPAARDSLAPVRRGSAAIAHAFVIWTSPLAAWSLPQAHVAERCDDRPRGLQNLMAAEMFFLIIGHVSSTIDVLNYRTRLINYQSLSGSHSRRVDSVTPPTPLKCEQ